MKRYNVWMLNAAFLFGSVSLVSCAKEQTAAQKEDTKKVAQFLQKAVETDNFGIVTGILATDKSKAEAVGDYGMTISNVHSKTSPVLEDLAKRKYVEVSQTLPAEKKTLVANLEKSDSLTFDKEFIDVQIAAQQEAVALYEEADKELKDAEIQSFIDQVLPVLKEHLKEAQDLKMAMVTPK